MDERMEKFKEIYGKYRQWTKEANGIYGMTFL
jgi:hypothetical protein